MARLLWGQSTPRSRVMIPGKASLPQLPLPDKKYFIKLSGVKKTRGDINLVYYDTQGNSKEYEVASGELSQDDVYTQYLDVEINPKNTTKIEFRWNKAVFSLLWARLGAETVNIIHGADGHRSTFCGHGTVAYGEPQILTPC